MSVVEEEVVVEKVGIKRTILQMIPAPEGMIAFEQDGGWEVVCGIVLVKAEQGDESWQEVLPLCKYGASRGQWGVGGSMCHALGASWPIEEDGDYAEGVSQWVCHWSELAVKVRRGKIELDRLHEFWKYVRSQGFDLDDF